MRGAFGEQGREQQAQKSGGPDDAPPALDEEFEEASRDFDELVSGVWMELIKHGLSPVVDSLMNGDVIEAVGKPNARVGEGQKVEGLQLTERPDNLCCGDAWKKPAQVRYLKGIGLVVIRFAGFGFTAPIFHLVGREVDLEA